MAEKKVTVMVIKVDLNCDKCRKKIKKVLCNIPQIQNQVYDEKANTVTITVVCCSPEKIKKKICCKGGESVKGIEIVPEKPKPKPQVKFKEPEKSEEPEKPKQPEKPKEKPKEPEKPKEKPKEAEKPKEVEKPKEPVPAPEKPKDPKPEKLPIVIDEPPKPKAPESTPKAPEPAPKAPEPIPAYPPPVRTCCEECYRGYGGGPCFHGYGRPPPCYVDYGTPAPCYEAYGRPVYDSWGGGGHGGCRRGCYVGRCDCLSEENPSACSVM